MPNGSEVTVKYAAKLVAAMIAFYGDRVPSAEVMEDTAQRLYLILNEFFAERLTVLDAQLSELQEK